MFLLQRPLPAGRGGVWGGRTGTDLCVSSNLRSAEQEVRLTSERLSLVEG